jgi:hypothetical protein
VQDLESSFQQGRQPLILGPLDEVRIVLPNKVKSLRFIESILCPIAPIIGEHVAKLGPIARKTTDLGILHFYDILVPDSLPGSQSRIFH